MLTFTCNCCSTRISSIPFDELDRETGFCPSCGANVRHRSILALLSLEAFGKSLDLARWPENRAFALAMVGEIGAKQKLSQKLTCVEPALDASREPFLRFDGVAKHLDGTANAVICSDVLQHLVPLRGAFAWLYRLLKPGGLLILTVPYGFEPTQEFFPNLHEWSIDGDGEERTLRNVTAAGKVETFDVAETYGAGRVAARLFGLADLRESLRKAGFTGVTIAGADNLQFGIQYRYPWGLPITARKP